MSKGSKTIIILLIIIAIAGAGYFIWKNGGINTNSNNTTNSTSQKNNETTSGTSEEINENLLEESVKKALIEIVNEKNYKDVSNKEGTTAAEGHKILESEIKNNQIYAYVVAEYGVYKLENGTATAVSASASPITLIFDTNETQEYKMSKYIVPSDAGDEEWTKSLKEMFPENLIKEATSINYKDDFYQKQIKSYVETLKSTNTTSTSNTAQDTTNDTNQILLNVMNNKQKFIQEDNKEVYLKDFKIVENQTAQVDKYTFVDMDKDGTEELVIYTTSDYGAYIILHYENNKVYGYMIGVRSLENLKTDGSFMASSGANSTEYLRITFNKNTYTMETEAIYDETNKNYKINNETVSETKIKEYVTNWNKKENAKWNK